MGPRRIEQSSNAPENPHVSTGRGTESGTLPGDCDLARLVKAWPGLSVEKRRAVLAVLDNGNARDCGAPAGPDVSEVGKLSGDAPRGESGPANTPPTGNASKGAA